MNATNAFFIWFFSGLDGLGGWFIFLLLSLIGVIWIFYDSSKRRLRVLGWRMGAILLAMLILPALIFRFSSAETQLSLDSFIETIFYLGLLGGIIPLVLGVGYYVTYKGLVGCSNGHVYEQELGQCPECARQNSSINPIQVPQPQIAPIPKPAPQPDVPILPSKPKVSAWLVSTDGRNYQLCQGETTVGRSPANDIQFSGESTVSRQHAKIHEREGRFYLTDLASSTGTKVNDRLIRQTTLLETDDEIQFGDHVVVRFVTTHR